MRYFFAIQLLLYTGLSSCQQQPALVKDNNEISRPAPDNDEEDVMVCIFEIEAEVQYEKWKRYLIRNLELDSLTTDTIPPGTYSVKINFEINSTGKLQNAKVAIDPGYGLGERVKKVVSGYKDFWKPAIRKGNPVSSFRTQMVTFIVEQEEEYCKEETPLELIL